MKKEIHPERHEITARCACGYAFKTSSTSPELKVTICSHCHPFFTGAQKFVDTAGRIEKFEKRYKKQETQPVPVAAPKAAKASKKKQK